MHKKIFFLVFVLLIYPNIAKANEPFDFINDIINSFQSARIAGEKFKKSSSNEVVSQMKDIIVFNNGIKEADSYIIPYLSSKNEIIKKSADSYHGIYSSIIKNNEDFLGILENALNNIEETSSKEGTILRKFSENIAHNEEMWRMIPLVTAMSTYSLIDQEKTEDGKLSYVIITSKEVNYLKKKLIDIFGASVKNGAKEGQYPLEATAAMLYSFLNQGWKTADVK